MEEVEQSLHKAKDSAAGADDIHYQILKHLPKETIHVLCHLFNNIWTTGQFPAIWREAIVVLIPKPGKDVKNPGYYHLIDRLSMYDNGMGS